MPARLVLAVSLCYCGSLLRSEECFVSTKAQMIKSESTPKYACRHRNRCKLCGRPRAVYRKFGICRICFRNLASGGLIPGVKKASW